MKFLGSFVVHNTIFNVQKLLMFIFCLILACAPPRSKIIDDIDVYSPEILDDGQPNAEGNFWEIVKSGKANLQQTSLIEIALIYFPFVDNVAPLLVERIEGLGITDLSALKGVTVNNSDQKLEFYSTRLKDISILGEFLNLRELTIRGSDVEDFSPISNLKKLRKLDIAYSKTKSLSALSGLTDLQTLTIDQESNLSLVPIQSLMEKHLDSNGKTIKLKVSFIKNRLKNNPTTVSGNSMNAKVTPTLVGQYTVYYIYNLTKESNPQLFGDVKGELVLKETEFYLNISEKSGIEKLLTWNGTYRTVGNLIYFKRENEENEYVNSFYWNENLSVTLVDRVSFENTTFGLLLTKKSDNPE